MGSTYRDFLQEREARYCMGRTSKHSLPGVQTWTEGILSMGEGYSKSGRKRRRVKHRVARTKRGPFSGRGSQDENKLVGNKSTTA